jgi:hypothetical protein
MDSYGVVPVWDHLLSVPGLVIYLMLLFAGLALVDRLTEGIPLKYRALNVFLYGVSMALCISWLFMSLGLWFYVKA